MDEGSVKRLCFFEAHGVDNTAGKGINLPSSSFRREKEKTIICPTGHKGGLTFSEISKIAHEGGD